ncbi:H-2 class I histocompatibility antigen, Q9 alpha chain-like isoform X1 [Ahaetulla prasina]|uniref:H-2 class I histocompatibility antigen, Q9 alpha chain-like isoform X1 n=1 Tax=Ahaetulla prasina TaxID=499056 RepID=UPI002647C03E|nr:H-2 class I histocompatibility antigen, Q9 alpha chain-like isoform X1 [Ahaetulla prasina]
MALRSAPFLLLVLVAVALRESCFGASSHSMKYFINAISEPSQGEPHFVSLGYVDGQVFVRYDSHSRRMKPRVSWMEKVGQDDPQYWDRETQIFRGHEELSRDHLETLRSRYNQSEGLHTWQRMYGCELQRDGSKGGFNQLGYEGRTFISFDKETLTWVASEPQAQMTQRKWNALPRMTQRNKIYLKEICIEWLEKYLSYGKEMLLRTDKMVVFRRPFDDRLQESFLSGSPDSPVAPLPGPGCPMHGHSCSRDLSLGLLQCSLHGAPLEEHSETPVSPECSCAGDRGSGSELPCNTYPAQTALAACCLLGALQGIGDYLQSAPWLRTRIFTGPSTAIYCHLLSPSDRCVLTERDSLGCCQPNNVE